MAITNLNVVGDAFFSRQLIIGITLKNALASNFEPPALARPYCHDDEELDIVTSQRRPHLERSTQCCVET